MHDGESNRCTSVPTDVLSAAAEHEILEALLGVLEPFGVAIVTVERERAFVKVAAKNSFTFLDVTWDPRDRFWYWLGPLVDGEIPSFEIGYDPNRSPNRYGLGWFGTLRAGRLEERDRSEILNHRRSPYSGAKAIALFAAEELRGDWSMRPILDRMILKNYCEQVEPHE